MERKKKRFDAVEASRQWRVETGRELAAMTVSQRIEFLNRRRAHFATSEATAVVREKPVRKYGR